MSVRAFTTMLLIALLALTATPSSAFAVRLRKTVPWNGRRLLQAGTYESSGDWGSSKTKVNTDGSSTTETDTPYYTGTSETQGRKLSATYGSSGNWGSSTTTTNADGSSTTTVNTPYYSGTTGTAATAPSQYDTPENRAAGEAIAANVLKGRKLSATYGSSGNWGSSTTTVNADGSTTTDTKTPYYSGSTKSPAIPPSQYATPQNRAAAESIAQNVVSG